jgi:hypothetical protein
VLNLYAGSTVRALLDVYPDIGLDKERFSVITSKMRNKGEGRGGKKEERRKTI